MRVLSLVVGTALVILLGCGQDEPVVACTAILIYGLDVTVTDATGRSICDATVTVSDGDYREILPGGLGQSCHYSGAAERRGRYQVVVQRAGYLSESRLIEVLSDVCHVRTVAATFILRAAQ